MSQFRAIGNSKKTSAYSTLVWQPNSVLRWTGESVACGKVGDGNAWQGDANVCKGDVDASKLGGVAASEGVPASDATATAAPVAAGWKTIVSSCCLEGKG
eukprot:gene17048-23341_t